MKPSRLSFPYAREEKGMPLLHAREENVIQHLGTWFSLFSIVDLHAQLW